MSLREWIAGFPAPRVATPATTATAEPEKCEVSQLSQLSQRLRAAEARPDGAALSQLSQPSHHAEPVDLRDLAPSALRLGSLVCCERCRHFEARSGERPDGGCRHHGETWARVPFACDDHAPRDIA